MKQFFTLSCILLFTAALNAQGVEAVTSLNYYGGLGLNPRGITASNNALYFSGTSNIDTFANNLYKSDGSTTGTILVKRINNSSQFSIGGFQEYNGKTIFADDGGRQLWQTDGTNVGTVPFAAVRVKGYTSKPFVAMNNKLYFAGGDTSGYTLHDQLWVTDGTQGGTNLVKTINSAGAANIFTMTAFNGNLYFNATDSTGQIHLYISDGTSAGTHVLKVIDNTGSSYTGDFVAYNSKLYFGAYDPIHSNQIWCTDGTSAGTVMVSDVDSTADGVEANTFTEFNGKLYFAGTSQVNSIHYTQLWVTDGTSAGTQIVKDTYGPFPSYTGFSPEYLTVYNNSLYMDAYDSINYRQLWKSDGTTAGTQRVTQSPNSFNPTRLTTLGSSLVFLAYDSANAATAVCISDGTAGGSHLYALAGAYGTDFSQFQGFVPFDNALYYNATYFSPFDYQVNKVYLTNVGINDLHISQLKLYPNPATTYLEIGSEQHIGLIEITDMTGRKVLSADGFNDNRIPLADLNSGIYIIDAQDAEGNKFTGKFVKE